MRFKDKVVIVTGGTGNLGSAVAALFAEEGASVALFARHGDQAAAEAQKLSGTHVGLGVDLTDRPAVEKAVQEVTEKLGAPDILCALAGAFDMGTPVHEVPAGDWDKMMSANLETALSALAAVTPGMIERGSGKIVTVGAYGAREGGKTMGPYAASKSAVMRVTESASAELKDKGINVNCVLPTIIDSAGNREAMPKADPDKWVSPESLAGVIAFLCSSEADDIHGALLPVTGRV